MLVQSAIMTRPQVDQMRETRCGQADVLGPYLGALVSIANNTNFYDTLATSAFANVTENQVTGKDNQIRQRLLGPK
jgi:hypothetical protein